MLDRDEIERRRAAHQFVLRRNHAIAVAISIALWALIALPLVIK